MQDDVFELDPGRRRTGQHADQLLDHIRRRAAQSECIRVRLGQEIDRPGPP